MCAISAMPRVGILFYIFYINYNLITLVLYLF